jgi:hypothetical protein
MALTEEDIKFFASESTPQNDVDPSGGDIDLLTELTNSSPTNVLIPTVTYQLPSGSDIVWYYKMFVKNTNTTDNLVNLKVFMNNLLEEIISSNFIVATPSGSVSGYIKLDGINNSDVNVSEMVQFISNNPINSANSYKKLYRAQVLDLDLNLTTAPVLITLTCGSQELGKIPVGCSTANGDIELAVDPTVNSTIQSADRLTVPNDGGATPIDLSFSRPNTSADGLSSPDGRLDANNQLGIWLKHTAHKGTSRSVDVQFIPSIQGDAE